MPELSPIYYQQNFLRVVHSVFDRYLDFFDAQEQADIKGFLAMKTNAQCVLLRLWMRRRSSVRSDKFAYTEIENIGIEIDTLTQQSWVQKNPQIDVQTLAAVLLKSELHQVFPWLNPKQAKADHIDLLVENYADKKQLFSTWWPTAKFDLITLGKPHLFQRLETLFFANPRRSLNDFVSHALGHRRCYPYPLSTQRYYPNRLALEQHLKLEHLRIMWQNRSVDIELLLQQLDELSTSIHLRAASSLKLEIGRYLQRNSEHEKALKIYAQVQRYDAFELHIRGLSKTGQFDQALKRLEAIDPRRASPAFLQFHRRFQAKLRQKLSLPFTPVKRQIIKTKKCTLSKLDSGVESSAAAYFSTQGDRCYFFESRLLNSIFALVYWEVIYADADGAFDHPFQQGPRDIYADDFFDKRRVEQEKAEKIWQQDYREILLQRYQRYAPYSNNWLANNIDHSVLKQILAVVPSRDWQILLDRLKTNLRRHRNGMPDLIQLHSHGYRWIEVKGPGDRLQDNQREWLHYFEQHEIDYWVLDVDYVEK